MDDLESEVKDVGIVFGVPLGQRFDHYFSINYK